MTSRSGGMDLPWSDAQQTSRGHAPMEGTRACWTADRTPGSDVDRPYKPLGWRGPVRFQGVQIYV